MQKSLRLFMITEIVLNFWLGHFLSIVYFHAINMTDFHISIFHAIMAVGIFLFDIPSGIFADRTGPRKSIILGYAAVSLAFFVYVAAYFTNFWVAIFWASLLFALSDGLRSGASQAYIFTLHRKLWIEHEYLSYMSRLGFCTSISTALAAVLGGYFFEAHPIIPYLIQGSLVIVATMLSFGLEEIHTPPVHPIHLRSQWEGIVSVLKHHRASLAIVGLMIAGVSTFEIFENLTNQSYWLESGIRVQDFWYIGLIIFVFNGLIVHQTPRFVRVFGKYVWIAIAALLILISVAMYFVHSFLLVAVLSALLYGLFSVTHRIADETLQKGIHIESVRTSFLSFANTVVNLVVRASFFLVVFLLWTYNYHETMLFMGVSFGVVCAVLGICYMKLIIKVD